MRVAVAPAYLTFGYLRFLGPAPMNLLRDAYLRGKQRFTGVGHAVRFRTDLTSLYVHRFALSIVTSGVFVQV